MVKLGAMVVMAGCLAGCLAGAGAAGAAETAMDMLDAPVAYTAHFYVNDASGTYRGTVWHLPGHERRDWDTAGGGQAVLLDRPADSAYLLQPSGKWYVGFGLHAAAALAGGLDQMQVRRQRLGEETVAGLRATRYRVAAASGNGGRFDGDAWFSRDGILVKASGTLTAPDGKTDRVETGLSDLEVGRADSGKLVLPGGYFGMDLRSVPADRLVQAVQGLKPLLDGKRQ